MANVNYSSNNEKEETELLVTSLLTDMSTKVVFMRQQHRARRKIKIAYIDISSEDDKEVKTNLCVAPENKHDKIEKCVFQIMAIMKDCCKDIDRLIHLLTSDKHTVFG